MNNFERLGLYPHNIEASKEVQGQFDAGADTVSIIHATGTGKSYIGLHLALERKGEKIVWIVPTNAIKEHIEETINNNPNISMKEDFSNLEIITYQSLINMTKEEIEKIPCDLLIVDELHHLGAPVWGARVKTFVDTHPDMKKFGMTAYNVRDRGTVYERDMTNPDTDEIFSDSVASVYDLYDAIIDGVLPKPIIKSVITENSQFILESKEKIQMLKRKGDTSYLYYEQAINDMVKIIHKQNGVKKLIQQTVKQNGKYIYFCPILTEEGKNDMNIIMDTMRGYLQEKFPEQNIVFYKSTSADGEYGKYNRNCFYNDKDLDGNDVTDAIRIIFVKNQYNEGVHAPNVDGVFLGRRTRSDIVAFEHIGRGLSVRGNTHEKMEEYSHYSLDQLKQLAISRGISIKEEDTKQQLIEKLIAPIIIDLADNLEFIEELETNLGNRLREIQEKGPGNKRVIKITDSSFDTEVINKDLLEILRQIRDNLNAKTWDDYYTLLVTYYEYYGNTDVSKNFKTKNGYEHDEEGLALGKWCSKQRHNADKLISDRRKKLELIGFKFENLNDLQWERYYALLVAYYEYHGNTEVPPRFKTKNGYEYDEEGIALGPWCNTQRIGSKKLKPDRRKKLELIRFRFDTNALDLRWDKNYALLVAYCEHHGNTEVPMKFKTKNGYEYDEGGVALGKWCNTQRSNADKLTTDRKNKLEMIGFRFKINDNNLQWEKTYALLVYYYEHYGDTEVPFKFKTKNGYEYDEEGVALGKWCSSQRTRAKNLKPDRKKKLEMIGFRFEIRKNVIVWEDWYLLLVAYYEHHGNIEVPIRFKTINGYEYNKEGLSLGSWCCDQRKNENNLKPEHKKKLEMIGFVFGNLNDLRWEKYYALLVSYYEHYGNTEVPTDFKTNNGYQYDEEGVALGKWCSHQRSNADELTFERKKKLELIEFRFDANVRVLKWDKNYELLIVYYEHYGNTEVPQDFKTTNGYEYDEEGVALGQWCSKQRRNENLESDRRKKLELVGFRFIKKKENEEKKINLCAEYGIDYKKYKSLKIIPYQELYAKIQFLIRNGDSLESDGKLNEIFDMCNDNMQLKYNINKEQLIMDYYINIKKRGV